MTHNGMKQPLLFGEQSDKVGHSGFRLDTLELYNWGTFNDQVWTITPHGQTSLLTGANGSGKSTIVDALLTLLVPNRKRNYNQAAGEGKGERSELSYMRGAYGRLQADEGYSSQIQYLRGKESYSVLLARFRGGESKKDVTLAQVFWFTDKLNKFFVVAADSLSIQEDFTQFSTIKELKRRLRTLSGVAVEDQFKRYSQQFRKQLGLRSDKALDLFNQTVTIKEIGRLNDFVRQHMLEKTDAQAKIEQLQDHFENLMIAYQALQKAQKQLDLLRPLAKESRRYEKTQRKIDLLRGCQDAIPVYFAGWKWQLVKAAKAAADQDYAKIEEELVGIDSTLNSLRQQEQDLHVAIRSDSTGQRLRELQKEIEYAQQTKKRKRADAEQYDQIAQKLGLHGYEDETHFVQNQEQAAQVQKRLKEELVQAAEALRTAQIDEDKVQQELADVKQEIDSLQQRTSQIPVRNLHLRDRILDALSISPVDVPFVGELLKVKEGESAWEGALERLLHSFALRLLVPERHYDRFAKYVNQNHLNGRIVFHRVSEKQLYRPQMPNDARSLPHKVDIKPDTAYYDWLQNELIERYDYTCCNTMADFERATRAITQNGLSRSGGRQNARFEKDDRKRLDNRRNYVLGWQNKDKIRSLEAEARALQQQLNTLKDRIQQAKTTQAQGQVRSGLLTNLLGYQRFADLDWRRDALQIQTLSDQKKRLEESSNQLTQLQKELEQVKVQITSQSQQRDKKNGDKGRLEHQLKQYAQQIQEASRIANSRDDETMMRYAPKIQEQVTGEITLVNVDGLWRGANQHFQKAIDKEQDRLRRHTGQVLKLMQAYKGAYPVETADFDASVESIGEFDREHERIERDDLPRLADRFRKMRDEKVIEAISLFQADLYKHREDIEENIADLNRSLRTIAYTPDTYIELKIENNRDMEIREFQQMLRDCLIDVGADRTEEAYEASFNKVRTLITRFKDETRWATKVTDVRQWLNFAAIERYTADGSEKHYYSDSSGKSGGQKAKLAYTILASAITFQFGLGHAVNTADTFRFVVVDEAFSRSDEDNSRYAMQLFQQLDLQLLVVTPNTGLQIVEPFIHGCHLVRNNSEGNSSRVTTMSIETLQQKRLSM